MTRELQKELLGTLTMINYYIISCIQLDYPPSLSPFLRLYTLRPSDTQTRPWKIVQTWCSPDPEAPIFSWLPHILPRFSYDFPIFFPSFSHFSHDCPIFSQFITGPPATSDDRNARSRLAAWCQDLQSQGLLGHRGAQDDVGDQVVDHGHVGPCQGWVFPWGNLRDLTRKSGIYHGSSMGCCFFLGNFHGFTWIFTYFFLGQRKWRRTWMQLVCHCFFSKSGGTDEKIQTYTNIILSKFNELGITRIMS